MLKRITKTTGLLLCAASVISFVPAKAADVQKFVAQVKVVSTKRDAFNPKGLGVYSMILKPYKEPRQ